MASNFSDSFNSALQGGALLQGIFYRQEERDLRKKANRADEYARGIDALTNQYGSPNPKDWDDQGREMLNDHLNQFVDLTGERPNGKIQSFDGMVPAGDGVAAQVTLDNSKGKASSGPLTTDGGVDDDSVVTVLTDVNQLKVPVYENTRFQLANFNARKNSPNAAKLFNIRENQQHETDALEGLYQRAQRIQGAGDPAANQPAVIPASAAAPQGLSTAAPQTAPPANQVPANVASPAQPPANPAAVTAPGPRPPSTPKAAGKYGTFDNTQKWKSPKAQDITINAAIENGLDPDLFQAVVYHESAGGDVNAQSPTGASGLGQMTGIAVKEVNRVYGTNYTRQQMRDDPDANADAAAKLLAYELKQHDGNVEQALAAYNGGRGALKKAGGDYTKMRPETAAYVPKIMAFLQPDGTAAAEGAPNDLSRGTIDRTRTTPRTEQEYVPQRDLAQGAVDRTGDEKAAAIAYAGPKPPASDASQAEKNAYYKPPKSAKAVAKEVEATPEPETKEEVAAAVETVVAKKPSQQWTPEERKHLYTLHRLNPTQMPIEKITSAFRSGRIGAATLKTFQNAAKQVIAIDDAGNQSVVGDTPAAQKIQQLELAKSQTDLTNKQLDARGKLGDQKAKQLALTKGSTEFQAEQGVNFTGDDPQKIAQHRDRFNVTAGNLGLDLTAQGTSTVLNKAAMLQKALHDTTSGFTPTWLGGDRTFDESGASDYSAGMTVLNAPGNPYDVNDNDDGFMIWDSSAEKAAEWVYDNYFDPMHEAYPGMDPQMLSQSTYLATEMMKMPGSRGNREEIIKTAGKLMSSGRYDNVAEAIATIKERAAFLSQ